MSFIDVAFYPAILLVITVISTVQRFCGSFSTALSKMILLLFSYVVIFLYDWRFCLCITAVIFITYFSAIWIEKSDDIKHRKIISASAVVILIAMLGVFKYLNFFMTGVMAVVGHSWTAVNIILPIGISFYVFSSIGYILDVLWGNFPAEYSFLDVALFVAFFPKLLCGPIVSARDLLPQMEENRKVSLKGLEIGAQIFVFGLFKKIVLADRIALFVDDVFASPAAYGSMTIWLAVLSYYIQLYFDFSGYSDMAIGVFRAFGYEIRRNFNLPFLARNISDFWDRWHISLSSWLNEYVFNPLAVKYKRKVAQLPRDKRKKYKMLPTYAALMITFLVSGVWHGAGLTFVVWGLCHGVYSVFHSMYADWMKKNHKQFVENKSRIWIIVDILANYLVINIIQVVFRARSIGQALYIYKRMFMMSGGITQPYIWSYLGFAVLAMATLAAVRRSVKMGLPASEGYYPIENLGTVRGLFWFFLAIGFTISLAYFGETYFIYGKF